MISVIVPALNEEKNIARTLKSIRKQRFEDYELILVDGKSEDKTRKIAKKYVDRIIISQKRSRQFQCNLGAKNAKGDILVFSHADTIMKSPRVLKSIDTAIKSTDVVAGRCKYRYNNKKIEYRIIEKRREIQGKLIGNMCNGDSVTFFRRDVFNKVGGWDENVLMDDLDITRKVKKHGRIGLTDELVITSARRFEEEGILKTFWKWTYSSLLLYLKIRINPEYNDIR